MRGYFCRLLPAFLVGEAGQRVLRDDKLVIGDTHHAGHGRGGVQEDVGDDGRGGDSQPLHFDAVVHTARATGASIADPGD